MKVNLELTILEAKALYESGIMDRLDEIVKGVNTKQSKDTTATAKTNVKKEEKQEEELPFEPDPVEKKDTETKISLEEVRSKLAELSTNGKQKEVKKLIESYGVSRFSDIDPNRYPELLKKAAKLA